jgi:hypothetical protein
MIKSSLKVLGKYLSSEITATEYFFGRIFFEISLTIDFFLLSLSMLEISSGISLLGPSLMLILEILSSMPQNSYTTDFLLSIICWII